MNGIAPVVESVEVRAAPEDAFELFTAGFGRWWPHRTHSVKPDEIEAVVLEPEVGGRVLERWRDGSEHVWGSIAAFEPPGRLVISWDPDTRGIRTEVEVTFTETPSGTRVRLVHRGWEALEEVAPDLRGSYETGWPVVLEAFARLTGEAPVAR